MDEITFIGKDTNVVDAQVDVNIVPYYRRTNIFYIIVGKQMDFSDKSNTLIWPHTSLCFMHLKL